MNYIKLLFDKTSGISSQTFDISKMILSSNLSQRNLNMQLSFEIFSYNSLVNICSNSREFEQNFRKLKPPSANLCFAFK